MPAHVSNLVLNHTPRIWAVSAWRNDGQSEIWVARFTTDLEYCPSIWILWKSHNFNWTSQVAAVLLFPIYLIKTMIARGTVLVNSVVNSVVTLNYVKRWLCDEAEEY